MPSPPDDPVFRSSLREAYVALAAWAVCGVYSITVCYLLGYHRTGAEVRTILGIPDWVVLGIIVPWLIADVFAGWYCFRLITDEDLGEDMDEALKGETGTEEPRDAT